MKNLLKRAAGSGQKLEMIYINNNNQLSQRMIKVISLSDSAVKAYCYHKRQFRTFNMANILSVAPVRQRRGA